MKRCLICQRRIWPWQRSERTRVLQKPMHADCANRYQKVRWPGEPEEEEWTGV